MAESTPFPISAAKAAKRPDSSRRAEAAAWLKGVTWQVASMRGTRGLPDVTAGAIPVPRVGMRLYAKGCRVGLMRDVLALLAENTPVVDPVANGTVQPGTWHYRFAAWGKDTGQAETGDATQTVIWDLGDGPVSVSNVIEDGCGNTTTIRIVTDAAAVESLADIGSPYVNTSTGVTNQGYSVRIGGIARDPETGLFNYYVTVTERKTKYVPEHVSSEDAFSVVKDASWTGLRGTVDAPTDDAGDAVTVYEPGTAADGTLRSVNWGLNQEDCTLNAQGRSQEAKENVETGTSCARDLFSERDSTSTAAVDAPLGHSPAPAGGVTVQRQSKLRADGLFDTAETVDTELPVASASVTTEVDLYSSSVSVQDRSQAADPAPASVASGTIRTVAVQKTAGDLKNITAVTRVELPVQRARVSKSSTVFDSAETVTDRSQLAAAAAPTSGGGVTSETATERTPGDLNNNTVTTRTEKPYPSAQKTMRVTVFRSSTRVVDKSSSSGAVTPSASGGVIVSSAETVTPGGLKDVTTDTDTELFVPSARKSSSLTLFESDVTEVDVNSPDTAPAASAGGGILVVPSEETTDGGLKNITVKTVTELPVASSAVQLSGDKYRVVTGRTDSNVAVPSAAPQGNITPGKIRSLSYRRTPGGLAVVDTSDTDFTAVTDAGIEERGDIQSFQRTVRNRNMVAPASDAAGFQGVGLPIKAVANTLNAAGVYDTDVTTDTPGECVIVGYFSYMMTKDGLIQVQNIRFFNATPANVEAIIALYRGGNRVEDRMTLNRFGLLDGELAFPPWIGGGIGDDSYKVFDKTYTEIKSEIVDVDGVWFERRATYTIHARRDWGLDSGYDLYDEALSGSEFRTLSGDWYEFKKVTAISVEFKALATPAAGVTYPNIGTDPET